jgi:hypothetical protein
VRNFIGPDYLGCFIQDNHLVFNDIVVYVTLICAIYNLIVIVYLFHRVKIIGGNSPAMLALKEACIRAIDYPIVMFVFWIFIWISYFFLDSNQANPTELVDIILSTLSSPLLGTGFFIAFLTNQPKARAFVRSLFLSGKILSPGELKNIHRSNDMLRSFHNKRNHVNNPLYELELSSSQSTSSIAFGLDSEAPHLNNRSSSSSDVMNSSYSIDSIDSSVDADDDVVTPARPTSASFRRENAGQQQQQQQPPVVNYSIMTEEELFRLVGC